MRRKTRGSPYRAAPLAVHAAAVSVDAVSLALVPPLKKRGFQLRIYRVWEELIIKVHAGLGHSLSGGLRPSEAKVLSTAQRLACTAKPIWLAFGRTTSTGTELVRRTLSPL